MDTDERQDNLNCRENNKKKTWREAKMNNYDYHEKRRAVREDDRGISAETSRVRNRRARTKPSESEEQSSARVSVYAPPRIEGGIARPLLWALTLAASLFLALRITQFLSENQNAVTSVEAISMVDLPPPPAPIQELPVLKELESEIEKPELEQFTDSNRNAPEPAWYRIQPKETPERAITIMMPGDASFRESSTRSPLGKVSHRTYTAKGKGVTFTASYSAIPKLALSLAGEKTIFTKARHTVLERAYAEQSSLEPTHCMGIPGLKLAYRTRPLEGTPSFNGVAYMFIIDRTLIVFNAVLSNLLPAGYGDRYFESIEVTHPLADADGLHQVTGCQTT